jgi:glucose/arabinose dehydrogenase
MNLQWKFGVRRPLAKLRCSCVTVALPVLIAATVAQAQQLSLHPLVQANFTGISEIGSSLGDITQMTFGPDGKLYVATFTNGIKRFDYSPDGTLSNGRTVWSRPADNANGQLNGSLGIAFHQDAALGSVMYIAPAVTGGFNVAINRTQSIVRLSDNDADGTWGETSEVNQAIVSNLRVTDLHQVNQLLVRNDTLYASVGSRTRTGGNVSELSGAANPDDGEFAYTGAINWIRDLTQLDGNTTTANIAGFTITNNSADTQPFTSNDTSKLTVFSTGFRNPYGLAFDGTGQLWATMNQNENPLKPDELHRTNFKDEHKFPKKNEVSGDWKTNSAATASGFFQTFKDPVALLGNDASADGIDFTYRNHAFAGHPFLVRFANGADLLAVDPTTGSLLQVATGFSQPLEVLTDPLGNLLVGTFGAGGKVYRLTLVDNAGDYNSDGAVDGADYVLWRKSLGQSGANLAADGDGNGFVNQLDYNFWQARYGKTVPTGAGSGTNVPEPTLFASLIAALLISLQHTFLRIGRGKRGGDECFATK